jgi:hypothetical protein
VKWVLDMLGQVLVSPEDKRALARIPNSEGVLPCMMAAFYYSTDVMEWLTEHAKIDINYMEPDVIGTILEGVDDSDKFNLAYTVLNSSNDPNIGSPLTHFFSGKNQLCPHQYDDEDGREAFLYPKIDFLTDLFGRIRDVNRPPFDFYSACFSVTDRIPGFSIDTDVRSTESQMHNLLKMVNKICNMSEKEYTPLFWKAAFQYQTFRWKASSKLVANLSSFLPIPQPANLVDTYFS